MLYFMQVLVFEYSRQDNEDDGRWMTPAESGLAFLGTWLWRLQLCDTPIRHLIIDTGTRLFFSRPGSLRILLVCCFQFARISVPKQCRGCALHSPSMPVPTPHIPEQDHMR